MILFTLITIALIIAAVIAVVTIGVFGGATLVMFGDVIVFGIIVWGIVKLIFRKKKK